MNWDRVAGHWKMAKGLIHYRWGKLTDGDLEKVRGGRDMLVGVVQDRYGLAKEEAMEQVADFLKTLEDKLPAL